MSSTASWYNIGLGSPRRRLPGDPDDDDDDLDDLYKSDAEDAQEGENEPWVHRGALSPIEEVTVTSTTEWYRRGAGDEPTDRAAAAGAAPVDENLAGTDRNVPIHEPVEPQGPQEAYRKPAEQPAEEPPSFPQLWRKSLPSQLPGESQFIPMPRPRGTAFDESKKIFQVNSAQYEKLERIGEGGSCKVYRVQNPQGEKFALKKVSVAAGRAPMTSAERRALEVYKEEIDMLLQLKNHESVIQVIEYEILPAQGLILIVMEIGEMDLNNYIRMNPRLSLRSLQTLWRQMLEGVQVIHDQRILHNDLKPANFLLVRGQLKVIDFGIAKRLDNDTSHMIFHGRGTASYMAPEAAGYIHNMPMGEKTKIKRSADIWSLGIILYQMLYGTTPFAKFDDPMERCKKLNDPSHVIEFPAFTGAHASHSDRAKDALRDVLERCLQRDPRRRATLPELLNHRLFHLDTRIGNPERLAALRAQRAKEVATLQEQQLKVQQQQEKLKEIEDKIEAEETLLEQATSEETQEQLKIDRKKREAEERAREAEAEAAGRVAERLHREAAEAEWRRREEAERMRKRAEAEQSEREAAEAERRRREEEDEAQLRRSAQPDASWAANARAERDMELEYICRTRRGSRLAQPEVPPATHGGERLRAEVLDDEGASSKLPAPLARASSASSATFTIPAPYGTIRTVTSQSTYGDDTLNLWKDPKGKADACAMTSRPRAVIGGA